MENIDKKYAELLEKNTNELNDDKELLMITTESIIENLFKELKLTKTLKQYEKCIQIYFGSEKIDEPENNNFPKPEKVKIVIFDVESNGFKGSSVLSISAYKIEVDPTTKEVEKIGEFDRYYFPKPGEKENKGATDINKLTEENVKKHRGTRCMYPKYFHEDKGFEEFCTGVDHFICHNVAFDSTFLDFPMKKTFCTMKKNTNVVKTGWNDYHQTYKWPKLEEAAKFYKLDIDESKFHGSLYDVEITYEVFKCMLKREDCLKSIDKFLEK